MRTPKPGPATSLSEVTKDATSITLSWHRPAVAVRPEYSVRYRVKGQAAWIEYPQRTDKTTMDVKGLKPRTEYEFEVETRNR